MSIIAKLAHSVRIYNIAVCYDNAVAILKSAKKYGMTVMLGLWMEGTDDSVFENELKALPGVMEEYGSIIEYVIVGNEPLFIEEMQLETVIENYKRTKAVLKEGGYPHLTSVAEVWPLLESETGFGLVDELDFVCMNMYSHPHVMLGRWDWCVGNPIGRDSMPSVQKMNLTVFQQVSR